MGFTKWVNEQSKAVKIILFIPFWGWIFGFLYRLFEFIEHKETSSLVGFILNVVPLIGFVMAIIDFVFIIAEGKLKFFVLGGENFGIEGKVGSTENNDSTESKAEDEKEEATESKADAIDVEVKEVESNDSKDGE